MTDIFGGKGWRGRMDEPYVCTLDDVTQQKATRELHEDPLDRMNAVQALRDWIRSQPHLSVRQDDRALLGLLRGAKFSQLRAREMVEGALQMAIKAPEWFRDIDTREKKLMNMLKRGYVVPLPKRDQNGCQILIHRIGKLDGSTKHMGTTEEIRAGVVLGMYSALDEFTQVNGTVFILDFTGITAKHLTRWKLEDIKKWSKLWQNNIPGRFKAFHYYNAGTFIDAMMAMIKPFMKKKFAERLHTHATAESLFKYIPKELLPVDYLPDDYTGPHQGSADEIVSDFVKTATSDDFREHLLYLTSDRFGIDESKRPKTAPVQESFRKLAVD